MGALVGSILVGVVVVLVAPLPASASSYLECKILRDYMSDLESVLDQKDQAVNAVIDKAALANSEKEFDAVDAAVSDHVALNNKNSLPSAKYMKALILEKCAD